MTAFSREELIARYDRIRRTKLHGRLHEVAVRAVYEALLDEGDSAIDGGAHSGKHTIPMANAVGQSGFVLAFEPSPIPHARLLANLSKSGIDNVRAERLAVTESLGDSVQFLVFPERPGVSGLRRRTDAAGKLDAEEISVSTTTLDTYSSHLHRLGFIKLDVEGAELQALYGARRIVETQQPVIHVEASYISWSAFNYGPKELLEYARKYEYQIVDITGLPMDSEQALDLSFRTPSVWDYLLVPDNDRGEVTRATLKDHMAAHYKRP